MSISSFFWMPQQSSFSLPTHFFYFLPLTCFLFFEVPYFDRGLIRRAFFIWFLELIPVATLRIPFNCFKPILKFQLCIFLSPVLFFFFGSLVLLCMIVYIHVLWYPLLYCIYLCILWIYFSSLCLCTPFSFFKIIFPSISLLYICTCFIVILAKSTA